MHTRLLSLARFGVDRMIRDQPASCVGFLLALVLCIAAFLAYSSFQLKVSQLEVIGQRLAAEQAFVTQSVVPVPETRRILRPFHSAEVVQALYDVSTLTKLPLSEVAFALNDGATHPYLRYSVSLTLVGDYVAIGRFVDQFHASLSDVSLDTFSCRREDIRAGALACDLSFAIFYHKDSGG